MKQKILFVVILVLISTSSGHAEPQIKFDCGDTYDWGAVMPAKAPLSCTVKILNSGDDTLKIKRVKAGCGCTTLQLARKIIPPGEYSNLSLKLSVPHKSGIVKKGVRIETNIPGNPTTIFKLRANVSLGYEISPNKMRFTATAKVDSATDFVVLINKSDMPIIVDSLSLNPTNMSVVGIADGTEIAPGEAIKISATIPGSNMRRVYSNIKIIGTKESAVKEINIRGLKMIIEEAASSK